MNNQSSLVKITDNIIKVEGKLDESFNYKDIKWPQSKVLVFDCEKIDFINSCGVREWIRMLELLEKKEELIYKSIPICMVNQMNMIEGFVTKKTKIESFYAPYFDENTDEEVMKLLKPSDVIEGKAPIFRNDSGHEIEFDSIEKVYFNFLKKELSI